MTIVVFDLGTNGVLKCMVYNMQADTDLVIQEKGVRIYMKKYIENVVTCFSTMFNFRINQF